MQPRSTYTEAAGYEIHVTEWGELDRPALLLWHGLARTGRDFDETASALAETHFVLCPDTIGRGLSSWAKPEEYNPAVYVQIALALLDAYAVTRFSFVGTSMGGIIGMLLASGPAKGRINRLVLNDIAPVLDPKALKRIGTYVAAPPAFDRVSAFEAWLRETYAPFGPNTDAFWRRMAETSVRRLPDGRLTVHYDPAIAEGFAALDDDAEGDLWAQYDAITAPTLVFRGADSDLLPAGVADEMRVRGPRPRIHTLPGIGHAPTLANDEQIGLLKDFLVS
ncbi:alpha/beta fold hydrolase [Pararhizobium mangrovi]|uniref:Alpha/beta hydrolase n=1 Tax=Pararhizobium mangrovi TaxID=2590452 RepID=A0A506U8E2_9HYPH|nr:alpha/beta hydrolase [Pararhizobium mangrovi]TPW28147.1 alpha/beta hydrolase [Pararhizobium mangrovi]